MNPTRPTDRPLVSVVILNYKRLRELEKCLETVVRQDWPHLEVIVVDNHSEEDVASVVRRASESIRLIELPRNLGSCVGRNAGLRQAQGDIVVTIDNDVAFMSAQEVTKIVHTFERNPEIHVLAFRICDAGSGKLRTREWCHPRDWQEYGNVEFETTFFGEGASAFRREVFDGVGYYWDRLFIGHEGYDLTIRLFNRGFRILYAPSITVSHSMSAETRGKDRAFHIYTRNYIWIAYKDHGFLRGLAYVAPKLLMMAAFSLRAGELRAFVRGLADGVRGLGEIETRTPALPAAIRHIAALESARPGLYRRLARHRMGTQL